MAVSKHTGWQVGQTIFLAQRNHRGQDAPLVERTVVKIGRKWISFKSSWAEGRFDPSDMCVDNGGIGYSDKVWRSKEEYEIAVGRSQAWAALAALIRNMHQPPQHVTTNEIAAFRALLTKAEPDSPGREG